MKTVRQIIDFPRTSTAAMFTGALGLFLLTIQAPAGAAVSDPDWQPARSADPIPTRIIEENVILDDRVRPDQVRVEVRDGVVTLSGAVDNLLAAERAARIARSVSGVREVRNQIRFRGGHLDDEWIRKQILMALAAEPDIAATDLDVMVRDGIVTLAGRVGSWAERHFAEETAKGEAGIRGVENGLSVERLAPRRDGEIAAAIERRIRQDDWLRGRGVDVAVRGGRVQLRGEVGTIEEKNRLAQQAWVAGVRSVDDLDVRLAGPGREFRDPPALSAQRDREVTNQLVVRPAGHRDDTDIALDIQSRLRRDARLAHSDVEVEVQDGRVRLSGMVGSDLERDLAIAKAEVLNVRSINADDLRVIPTRAARQWPHSTAPSDQEIEAAIVQLYRAHPFLSPAEVEVRVDNGSVTLGGMVDSPQAREVAYREAWRVDGVKAVRSFVQVAPPQPPPLRRPEVGVAGERQTGRAWARIGGFSAHDQEVAAMVELLPTQGSNVRGTIYFVPEPQGIRLTGQITGLPSREHGFHVHEYGDCSAPDASSAGDHFNPTGEPHGGPHSGQRHMGDLGNVTAGPHGVAHVSMVDMVIQLHGPHSIIGKSLIVHSEPDDLVSQPSGNAGARLACGIIRAQPGIQVLRE